MKKNNKGFSLVELIIVIAIMAILAGALAPALIKYINKSRRSADVSNADTIRTACQTALSDEEAMNDFITKKGSGAVTDTVSNLKGSGYGAFGTELTSILGNATITSKYFSKGKEFKVTINVGANTVTVTDNSGSTQISPEPGTTSTSGK